MTCDGRLICSEGTAGKEICQRWRNATTLTSPALSLLSTAAWETSHFKCQQARWSREGMGGLTEGGYWGRADLIKHQAATLHPPFSSHFSPPHLSSTERGNKSDRVQSLSLICQWEEWVGMRLSGRPGCGMSAVSALLNYDLAGSGMLWATRGLRWDIVDVDLVREKKQLKWNLSVCKVHDVLYEVMGFEEILNRLWWKDDFRQILGGVIYPAAPIRSIWCTVSVWNNGCALTK